MSLSLCFRQNLELRLTLCQKLGLESEYFESFLVRTEKLLKQTRYQKGLMLIEETDTDYRSVMDWLLAMLSPSWKVHIHAFYKYDHCKLGHAVDFETIDLMDQIMEASVIELYKSYQMLQREGWLVGKGKPEPGVFMQRSTMNAIRSFISPMFPEAPPHPGYAPYDARRRMVS